MSILAEVLRSGCFVLCFYVSMSSVIQNAADDGGIVCPTQFKVKFKVKIILND